MTYTAKQRRLRAAEAAAKPYREALIVARLRRAAAEGFEVCVFTAAGRARFGKIKEYEIIREPPNIHGFVLLDGGHGFDSNVPLKVIVRVERWADGIVEWPAEEAVA